MKTNAKKILKVILYFHAISLLLLLLVSYWYFKDVIHIETLTFEDATKLVSPHFTLLTPLNTNGPHPAIVLMPGCGGVREYNLIKAKKFVDQGYAALIVDSHTPRNIDWEQHCQGRVLLGNQRVTDLLVALEHLRNLPEIDANNLFIAGFSHGAWTALEALHDGEQLPRGLTNSPGNHFAGLKAVVVWYPYCGALAQFTDGWQQPIPTLMLLAEEDTTTPAAHCVDVATKAINMGLPLKYTVYPDVGHSFDTNASWTPIFIQSTADTAHQQQFEFLSRHRQ
jgi:dienelactone hydrolase